MKQQIAATFRLIATSAKKAQDATTGESYALPASINDDEFASELQGWLEEGWNIQSVTPLGKIELEPLSSCIPVLVVFEK